MRTFDSDDRPSSDRDRVFVGVSESVVVDGGETLVAYGLGSTVAIAMYDPTVGVGGLANAVVPTREEGRGGTADKFVDTAVRGLLRELTERGAGYANLRAKLAGGAIIVTFEELDTGVGAENVAAARRELARLDVPVVAEATGGDHGRTIRFDTDTGAMTVETAGSDVPGRI
jgi:chemotaxis protein CheD